MLASRHSRHASQRLLGCIRLLNVQALKRFVTLFICKLRSSLEATRQKNQKQMQETHIQHRLERFDLAQQCILLFERFRFVPCPHSQESSPWAHSHCCLDKLATLRSKINLFKKGLSSTLLVLTKQLYSHHLVVVETSLFCHDTHYWVNGRVWMNKPDVRSSHTLLVDEYLVSRKAARLKQ